MDHIERLHWIAQQCFALAGEKQGIAAENLRTLGREYEERAVAAAHRPTGETRRGHGRRVEVPAR